MRIVRSPPGSVFPALKPPVGAREPAEVAAAVLEAVNDRDRDALVALLDADSEVVTGRGVHTGADEIAAWAFKEFDHLFRRYAIDQIREGPSSLLVLGFVEHVWSGTGDVADSSPVALELVVDRAHLRTLQVHDDAVTALAGFDA